MQKITIAYGARTVLVLYLLFLLWLILLKLSFDVPSVLEYQTRSLNLIPFAGNSPREVIDNFVVFVPLGLLLCTGFKQTTLLRKLAFVFVFSLTAEMIQFVLAIGRTDITDVITNTLGGFTGLVLYDLLSKHVKEEKMDRCIVAASVILLIVFILLRTLVFRVRY